MIEYLSLQRITAMHHSEIQQAVSAVVSSGWYLQGTCVKTFEEQFAAYIGTSYCATCGNGLDALRLMLQAAVILGRLQPGDGVMVPANTFIASILAITAAGLRPVLIEPLEDSLEMDMQHAEKMIDKGVSALLLVHLYGRNTYTDAVAQFAQRHHLTLFEDNAQAHGCRTAYGVTGSMGYAAAHSFYPGKNLGALGDAGAVTSNDSQLIATIKMLGNYGSSKKYVFDYQGVNSRMDELQAAVLTVKLRFLDEDNQRRKDIASRYYRDIHNALIRLPRYQEANVYHIFPIFTSLRDKLQHYLLEQGIHTAIHYPIAPHQQHCYPQFSALTLPVTERLHREELSLPCNQALTDNEVNTIINAVNRFKG